MPWKNSRERIASLRNGLKKAKATSNTQPWFTMWIAFVRYGRLVWRWNLMRKLGSAINIVATYHHHGDHLLGDRRRHVEGVIHRQPFKVEDPDSTKHLCTWLHDANIQHNQGRLKKLVDGHFRWLPVAEAVNQHSLPGLIAIGCSGNDVFFAKKRKLQGIYFVNPLDVVFAQFCVSAKLEK